MGDGLLTSTTITERVPLSTLFWIFLKIGSVAFGGFMALITVIADTMVEKRQLLKHEDMLDCISLANLLPGPQGVNCVAYVGYRLHGGLGALVSVVGVLLPTFVLIVVLTGLYVTYASNVAVLSNLFAGFTPAVAAVIVSVVHRMAKGILKGRPEVLLTILAALVLAAAPRTMRLYVTLGIVTSFGLAGYALFRRHHVCPPVYQTRLPWARLLVPLVVLGLLIVAFLAHPPLAPRGLAQLALTFSGLSLLLFGGGYVFIPMMQDVVVTHYGWLTTQQFLDGVALSQVTPGPILVIATFIAQKVMMEQSGWLYGLFGAVVGTVSIFTPPAVLMITASMALDSLKQAPGVQAVLRGIRCGVLGMIAIAALAILYTGMPACPDSLSTPALTHYLSAMWPTVLIFVAALVALVKYNIDLVLIIPSAGLLGLFLY
jgi:chromate transporter